MIQAVAGEASCAKIARRSLPACCGHFGLHLRAGALAQATFLAFRAEIAKRRRGRRGLVMQPIRRLPSVKINPYFNQPVKKN